jgi:hypothetical protein
MIPSQARAYTQFIKEMASRHGFMGAGIARAQHMDEEAKHLEQWLAKGYHGEMAYMANHFDLRVDPTKLVPGAKSVISLLYNYYPGERETKAKAKSKIPEARSGTEHEDEANLTSHDSRLTIHDPHLTAHRSPLTIHASRLTKHHSPLTAHCLLKRTPHRMLRSSPTKSASKSAAMLMAKITTKSSAGN